MNSSQIETNIKELIKSYNKDSFIYDLLRAYGKPKSSITRLESGNLNLSKDENTIYWKKELYFQIIEDKDLHHTIDDLEKDSSILRHHPRFIIVTDHETILAVDTKTNDKLDIEIERLDKQFHFFLPWAGMEKSQYQNENPADLKAATTMARLFDEIKKHNNPESDIEIHSLNMFMCRMLFCFFAEDTNIFENDIFTNGISSHTQSDGSDLNEYLDRLFEVLNTDDNNRTNLPDYLSVFPYVNGGLFKDSYKAPKFTKHSRQIIIECGTLDWAEINPDIFGSMMQGVVSFEDRGNVGMHYTSVENIMKLIKPLFLDELYRIDELYRNKITPKQKTLSPQQLDQLNNIRIDEVKELFKTPITEETTISEIFKLFNDRFGIKWNKNELEDLLAEITKIEYNCGSVFHFSPHEPMSPRTEKEITRPKHTEPVQTKDTLNIPRIIRKTGNIKDLQEQVKENVPPVKVKWKNPPLNADKVITNAYFNHDEYNDAIKTLLFN